MLLLGSAGIIVGFDGDEADQADEASVCLLGLHVQSQDICWLSPEHVGQPLPGQLVEAFR